MADQKETFTAAEYSAWRKVQRIMAEDGGDAPEPNKEQPESDDPSVAYNEKQRKLWEERERKQASITDDQKKLADDLLDRWRW